MKCVCWYLESYEIKDKDEMMTDSADPDQTVWFATALFAQTCQHQYLDFFY